VATAVLAGGLIWCGAERRIAGAAVLETAATTRDLRRPARHQSWA